MMAIKSIAAIDTHRCQYCNGTLTAIRLGTTVRLKFYDGADNELGYVVHINAKGYFCNQNGDLYSNGVFVREDATIRYTAPDGANTSWTVKGPIDTDVNDGKLLDLNGNVVWSANSGNDYTLNYQDLANKPRINEWAECDQFVTVTSIPVDDIDTVTIDRHAKILTVAVSENLGVIPTQLRLKLTPEVATRWGQVIEVKNNTNYPLWLFNMDLSIAALVKPLSRTSMTYGIDQKYTSQTIPQPASASGSSYTVRDACPFHLQVNGNYVTVDLENSYYTLNLVNGAPDMFVLEYIPRNTMTDTPLLVRVNNANGQEIRYFWVAPQSSVLCIAGVGGSWLTTIGDTKIEDNCEVQAPQNTSGAQSGQFTASFKNSVDTAILHCINTGMSGGTPDSIVPCDFYFNFNAGRRKPIVIFVRNVTFAYMKYRIMDVKVGGVSVPVNYPENPGVTADIMRPKNMDATDQSYMKYLRIEIHFVQSNGNVNCLATANWTGNW